MNGKSHSSQSVSSSDAGNPIYRLLAFNFVFVLLIGALVGVTHFGAKMVRAEEASEAADFAVYLPSAMDQYFMGAETNPEGISGSVAVSGETAEDTPLELRFNDGFSWSEAATTDSNNEGGYLFEDVDPLAPGEEYYVQFSNDTDPDLVYTWYGPIIDTYRKGDRVPGGDFDIADVPLNKPSEGTVSQLPLIFEWDKRDLAGETYRLAIVDLEEDVFWRTFDLGDVDEFELRALAPDILYNKKYSWYIEVYVGPDSFGESFEAREITFLPPDPPASPSTNAAAAHPFEQMTGRGGR